jgi:glycosyltransferase involved in cell wall biosynthesis
VAIVKKRILWLHTQPEFYHNLMLDDLARGSGYRLPGMPEGHTEEFEWIAGFAHRGPGCYTEHALPGTAPCVFLRVQPGKEAHPPTLRERYHIDWRGDLRKLGDGPLGPDVVIVSGYGQRTFREIIAACHAQKVPVIMWSDSNLRAERGRSWRQRGKRCLKRRVLRRLSAQVDCLLTANSRGVAYWRYYGGDRTRVNIAVSACYSDYLRIEAANRRPKEEVLAKAGLSGVKRMVYSSARLAPVKGLDLMIKAFQAGCYAERGWSYVIAGTGVMEAELKALAGADLGKSIYLIGFQQPSENLALMAHADLFVLPSRYEPHGIVIGEALAAGTPVLASDVVGAAYGVVREGHSGMLFRSEDVADLQRQLALLEDPAKLAQMRLGARQAFEEWYRRTSPILVVPQLVRKLLARGGGHA